jgi:hypothetical protein
MPCPHILPAASELKPQMQPLVCVQHLRDTKGADEAAATLLTVPRYGRTRISQAERDAYPPELVVLWQPCAPLFKPSPPLRLACPRTRTTSAGRKAWVDRPTALMWAKRGWKPMIDADIKAGVADATTRYLLFQDNLDAQCKSRNPDYIHYLEAECQTDDHKVRHPTSRHTQSTSQHTATPLVGATKQDGPGAAHRPWHWPARKVLCWQLLGRVAVRRRQSGEVGERYF